MCCVHDGAYSATYAVWNAMKLKLTLLSAKAVPFIAHHRLGSNLADFARHAGRYSFPWRLWRQQLWLPLLCASAQLQRRADS